MKIAAHRRALTVEMTSGSLWKNILLFSLLNKFTQVLQGHHPFNRIFTYRQTAQVNNMRATTEFFTQVINDGADISAF